MTIKIRNQLFPGKYTVQGLSGLKTIRAFDNQYAPYHGYIDAADYYKQASCIFVINKIKIPTLLIAANDDPVIPLSSFQTIHNPHIQIMTTKYGGHGGFITRKKNDDPDRHWAENRVVDFILAKK